MFLGVEILGIFPMLQYGSLVYVLAFKFSGQDLGQIYHLEIILFANEDYSITKWLPVDATWLAFEAADISGLNGKSNAWVEVAVRNKKNNSIVIVKESARVKMSFSK